MKKTSFALFLLLLTILTTPLFAATVLVPKNSVWKYLDNGTNQGSVWRGSGFVDSAWSSGAGQLGYGDGDESTVVSFGSNSSAKYITTYFRHRFSVSNPALYTSLTINLLRDDGAVVYLNGAELFRSNMPTGTISYTTPASVALGTPEEATYYSFALANTLVSGDNVLAVEIHQNNGSSSDISFDLELTASSGLNVIRGPYLQNATPTSMTVRWRTDSATDSRVRYGLSAANLSSFQDHPTSTTEHIVQLNGLLPDTRYYYSVGTTTADLAGDGSYFFDTPPNPGTVQVIQFWVIGDAGTADANAAAVRNAYLSYKSGGYTDFWLMLGDNAYTDGTDAQYQAAVFDMYPTLLRQSPLWATLGNHDGHTANSSTQSGPYYDIFTLPKNGEAGGFASGTEAYYSFDYGNIHFICLESYETNRTVNGAMLTWLQNDVNNTNKDWIIAFWHHPPYTKGSHNSDTEIELIEMRQNALPILEQAGVDLVLTGHSHSYERTFLIDGHYGSSSTFTSSMKKDGGSGREGDTGAYVKPTSGLAPHQGAVYVVAGSSGKISGGTLNHPAMYISLNSLGSLVVDVENKKLIARFLDNNGLVRDYFMIVKGAGSSPAAPTNLSASAVSNSQINLSWTDLADNELGFKIERSTNNVNFTQIATVGTNITSFQNTGLSGNTTYYYRVRAYNGAGDSAYSAVASATTQSNPTLPAAPSNLAASPVSRNTIQLNWADNSSNENGFAVEFSTNGTRYKVKSNVGPNVNSFSVTGLKRNTTYYFRVRAFNGSGNSAYSNVATAKTLP